MKNRIYILILYVTLSSLAFGQPNLNERYEIGGESNSVFGSIVVTDSCYYVAGIHTSSPSYSETKGSFIQFNFDGSIEKLSTMQNDTMGIDMWVGNNLIPTLDGNFAYMAHTKGENSQFAFMFLKIAPNGDTLFSNYLYNFYEENGERGIRPSVLFQDEDSSYYGLLRVQRESDLEGGTVFYRLDKNGVLLSQSSYYQIGKFHNVVPRSLTKKNDSTFLIGTTLWYSFGVDAEDTEFLTKLIEVDTIGEIVNQEILFDDSLALDCNSLIKTEDDGYIFCGRKGQFYSETNSLRYEARIKKISSDYTDEWEIRAGRPNVETHINLFKVIRISESEFVTVGYMFGEGNFSGYLMKFNIHGEMIWERYYYKVPHYNGETNWASHELYDVKQTPDGGFVMVGQSVNYHENPEPFGQMGWLVKTNSYGCIVPGCQFGDIPVSSEPKDTTKINPSEPEEPKTWLYPNPANTSLFYYHHQDSFNFGTAYIYNSAGELVQKWDITANDITYEIDVSGFASGQYVLLVLDGDGVEIETERFVKI